MKELRKHFESMIKASDEAYAGINGKFTQFIGMKREGDDDGTKKLFSKISRPFPDGFAWIIPSGPFKGKMVKEFFRDENNCNCGLVLETMETTTKAEKNGKTEKTKYIYFTEFPIRELVKLLRCVENLNFGKEEQINLATTMTESDLDKKENEEKTPLQELVEVYTKQAKEGEGKDQQEKKPEQKGQSENNNPEEKEPEEKISEESPKPTYTGKPIEPNPDVFG